MLLFPEPHARIREALQSLIEVSFEIGSPRQPYRDLRTQWAGRQGPMGVTLKGRERVFENTRFTVFSDHISTDSQEVEDFLVLAPHTCRPDLLTGIVVVPEGQGYILLLKHYRHPVSGYVWELPRGFIDNGEDPATAAGRELAEETGLVCGNLLSLGEFFPDPGIIRARVALFAAPACQYGGAMTDDEIGIEERVWFQRDEVRRMLGEGLIEEGASCVALYRYFAMIDGGKVA